MITVKLYALSSKAHCCQLNAKLAMVSGPLPASLLFQPMNINDSQFYTATTHTPPHIRI